MKTFETKGGAKKVQKRKRNICEEAELELIQSLGESIKRRSEPVEKDEDKLFAELLATQLKQLPQPQKLLVKIEINNLVYNRLLQSSSIEEAHSMPHFQTHHQFSPGISSKPGTSQAQATEPDFALPSFRPGYYPHSF